MLLGDVVEFLDVLGDVVKHKWLALLRADGLVVTMTHCLLESTFVKFPIEKFMRLLFLLAKQRG